MTQEPNIYELAGGDAPFRRLVDSFYARVERDPLLRPLFPADLVPGKERQFLFITQYFGGPARYNQQRGHPRLLEPARSVLQEYFERAATFLINANANPNSVELLG